MHRARLIQVKFHLGQEVTSSTLDASVATVTRAATAHLPRTVECSCYALGIAPTCVLPTDGKTRVAAIEATEETVPTALLRHTPALRTSPWSNTPPSLCRSSTFASSPLAALTDRPSSTPLQSTSSTFQKAARSTSASLLCTTSSCSSHLY